MNKLYIIQNKKSSYGLSICIDDAKRMLSQARAEFIAHEKALNRKLSQNAEEIAALTSEKQALATENHILVSEIERLHAKLAE